ncbi:signal peptidase I [Hujiaoplasma nucleasis]|uniref:Signal peptidase I n=1 Tax=Hujiaoplasma nucleasis TaxID=2725268 RepID=A0A7L6N1E1_9MOLU|nr:signal peptidase I [Hujiaoplasma nucleasis]QLY40080.1 signal peptidase I [Hujiaoplasma nucleasis]
MKRKFKKILSYMPFVLLAITLLLIMQLGYSLANGEVPTIFGKAIAYVPTKSMQDEIMAGDMIIIDTSYDQVYEGDIVSFYANVDGKRVSITHRIIAINGDVFTTKGDNNDIIYDWEKNISKDNIIGVYRGSKSAFIGGIYGALFSSNFNILFLLIILIFVVIMVLEAINIIKQIQEHKQKDEKEKLINEAKEKLREKEDDA